MKKDFYQWICEISMDELEDIVALGATGFYGEEHDAIIKEYHKRISSGSFNDAESVICA